MKRTLIPMLLVLFFSACSTSSLWLKNDDEIKLKFNKSEFSFGNKYYEDKLLNFKDLFVQQYKITNKKARVLFYEDVITSLDYELNFSDLYTVMHIFDDAQEYEEIYNKNNLILVQLKLKNEKYINVVIQSNDTQMISFIYGFSNDEFIKLAQKINLDSTQKIERLKYEALTLDSFSKYMTNWNDELVYFTPLIMPFRAMSAF